MIRINNPKSYFKYFILILPFFVLLSCTDNKPEGTVIKTYAITFETNGGSAIDSQTIADGEKAIKPVNDPTKDGQVFVGWHSTLDSTGDAFDFNTTINKDLTLYAIWIDKIKTYAITFETNGGSAIDSQTIADGEKAVKPVNDPTKDGQVFVGWHSTLDSTGDAFDFNTTINKDLTLYAIWIDKIKTYAITFETNGGSAIDSQTIADGEKAVKPVNDPTKDGQVFVGWHSTLDSTGDAFDFNTTINKDLTLYAIWIDITKTYTIAFETNGGDAVSEQKTKGGGKVTFVGVNQADKAFIWWYTSATLEVNTRYDFDKAVTENITLYAKWDEASRYMISEDKITHIKDASGVLEIPYSVDGSQVKAVEGKYIRNNIFVLENNVENKTVTEVILPNSIENIGGNAFYFCKSLTSITIPDSVTSIGSFAFFTCTSLISITIPNSVTSIGDYTFAACSSLTSITIPNSVTSIESAAFLGCGLTSITIPNSVESIARKAFALCGRLANVRVEAITPPTLGDDDVFDSTSGNLSITVPVASLETYKAATFWSGYATKITGY